MATFKRGLDKEFVDALNEQYERKEAGWWSQFVDDKDLFLAIRGNQVDVYYQGCRLISVEWNGKLAAKTHYKYLLQPAMKPEYVDVVDGKPCFDASAHFADYLSVKELKKAATVYAGDEKEGVHKILRRNPNILDVEVSIGGGKGQIDFAALQEGKVGQTHIVFYEAKHFDNKDLRSESDRIPVVEQIDRYRGLLKQYRASIEDSYLLVSKNLCDLEGVRDRNPKRHDLLRRTSRFIIEEEPGLVVFGFDDDQKSGSVWGKHKAELKRQLRRKPRFRGNPAGMKIPS